LVSRAHQVARFLVPRELGQGRRKGVLVGALQSEREEETRD